MSDVLVLVGLVAAIVAAFVAALALWRLVGTLTLGVGAVEGVGEALSAIRAQITNVSSKLADLQAPNALVTRLADVETKMQGAQLLVSDAVERITALANRQNARIARARAATLDEDEEPAEAELSPGERAAALKALGAAGLTVEPSGTGPGESPEAPRASGWDRVRQRARTQQHRKEA